jgi:hypothetical protein
MPPWMPPRRRCPPARASFPPLLLLPLLLGTDTGRAQQPSLPLYNAAAPGMTMSASGLGTGGPGCYNESSDQMASFNASVRIRPHRRMFARVRARWPPQRSLMAWVGACMQLSWLHLGGRRFDGAISYACDRGIGAAIAQSGVPRGEVFITSKVGPGGVPFPLGFNETLSQAQRILRDLRSDYVDLLLIHEPFS